MPVTVPVVLTPDEESALRAKANAEGVSIDALLRRAVLQVISATPPRLSAEELDKAFEEIADLIPVGLPPVPNETLNRESMYTREDEWNRP